MAKFGSFIDAEQAPRKAPTLTAKQKEFNDFAQSLIDNVGKVGVAEMGEDPENPGKRESSRAFRVSLFHAAVDRLGVNPKSFSTWEVGSKPGVVYCKVTEFNAEEAAARLAASDGKVTTDEEAEKAIEESEVPAEATAKK